MSLIFSLRHTSRPLLSVTVVYDNSIHLERKACELDPDQTNFIGILPHFGDGLQINVRSTGCFVPNSEQKTSGPAIINFNSSQTLSSLPICISDSRSTNVNVITYRLEFDVVRHANTVRESISLNKPELFRSACNARQKIMNLQHRISQIHQIPSNYKKYQPKKTFFASHIDTVADLIVHVNTKIKHKIQEALQTLPMETIPASVVDLFEHPKQNLWSTLKSYKVVPTSSTRLSETLLHDIYSCLGTLHNIDSISDTDVATCAKMCLVEESELAAFTKNHILLQQMRSQTLQKIEESRHSKRRVVLTSRALFVLLRAIDNVMCSNLHACFNIGYNKHMRTHEQSIDLRAAFLRHKTCDLLLNQVIENRHDDYSSIPPTFFDELRVSMHNVQDMLHCLPNSKSAFLPCVARCLLNATLKLVCNNTNQNAHKILHKQNPNLFNKLRILPVATKLNFTYASRRSDVLFHRVNHSSVDVGDEDFYRNCMDMYLEIIHASHDTYEISRHVMLDAYNFLRSPETVFADGKFTQNFTQFLKIFTPSMQNLVRYINAPSTINLHSHVFEAGNSLFAFLDESRIFANEFKIDYTLNAIVTLFNNASSPPVFYDIVTAQQAEVC